MLIGNMTTFMVGLPTSINPINKSLIGNRHTLGQLNLDNVSLSPSSQYIVASQQSKPATTLDTVSMSIRHLNSTISSPDLELLPQLGVIR